MKSKIFSYIAALALASALVGCGGVKGGTSTGPVTSPSQPGTGTGNKPYTGVNVLTWHGDNARTGLNANETLLTPSNVHVSTFGKLFSYQVDGHVYAQPLYVSNVPVGGKLHNVLYVATENDSIYAFDADEPGTGAPLWKTSLLKSGETPVTGGNPAPFIGITSTPVIDVQAKTLFTVGAFSGGKLRLEALDIESGNVRSAVDIQASVDSTLPEAVNGRIELSTACLNRSALLLTQGTVFVAFGGCPHGWLLSYDEGSLQQTAVLNIESQSRRIRQISRWWRNLGIGRRCCGG